MMEKGDSDGYQEECGKDGGDLQDHSGRPYYLPGPFFESFLEMGLYRPGRGLSPDGFRRVLTMKRIHAEGLQQEIESSFFYALKRSDDESSPWCEDSVGINCPAEDA
jgi:hypothetical protein